MSWGRQILASSAALLATIAAAGCGSNSPAPADGGRGPRAARDAGARPPDADAGEPHRERAELQIEIPIPDAGDLVSEVTGFRRRAACLDRLKAATPLAISDVLTDIGYPEPASDACTTIEALAAKNIARCDRIGVRAARDGCARRYAMYHGDPEACPAELGSGDRDPTCVAVAMRDPSLCQAASTAADVGLCRAIILRNARPCRVAHDTARDAAACARAASRWWRVIPPRRPRPALPAGWTPHLSLCFADGPPAPDAGPPETDGEGCRTNRTLLRRGLVLRTDGPLVIGATRGLPIGPREPILEIRVPVPDDALPMTFSVGDDARVRLAWEPDPIAPVTGDAVEGAVTIERFEPRRGARVSGYLSVRGDEIDGGRWITGTFSTFLRDVNPPPPRRPAASSLE